MRELADQAMAFSYDPELLPILAALAEAGGDAEGAAPGDVMALRQYIDAGCLALLSRLHATPSVRRTDHHLAAPDGSDLMLSWYSKAGVSPGSAVVYVHGGGMVGGSPHVYDPLVRRYVETSGVPFLAVRYGLAPERRAQGLSMDVLHALLWLIDHCAEFGVDPARIALMGDSGGGGVAAGAAIRARDAGFRLARQILIYPMLDDRNVTPDPALEALALWTYDQNATAWAAVAGGGGEVTPYSVPARLADFTGLAPAFIEVGELDIFRDESIRYAQALLAAGVSCELQVQPGIPHGAEWLDFDAPFSRRIMAERARVISSI